MSRAPLRFDTFSGGLLESCPPRECPAQFTPSAENVDIEVDGSISLPSRGLERFSRVPLVAGQAVTGLWVLRRNNGTRAILGACDAKLFEIHPTGEVTLIGALHGDNRTLYSAASYGGRLFICSGAGSPQVYDRELEDLSGLEGVDLPPTWHAGNWPTGVALMNAGGAERLAMWGCAEDPSAFWECALFNHLLWNESGDSLNLAPGDGDGDRLIKVVGFQELTLCMKQRRTYLLGEIDYSTGTPAAMQAIPFGADSFDGGPAEAGPFMWSTPLGFSLLEAALEPGAAAKGVFASARIPESLKRISKTRRRQIKVVWDDELKRLLFAAPGLKSVENELLLAYYPYHVNKDVHGEISGAWMVHSGVKVSAMASFLGVNGSVVLAGGYDGYVNRLGFNRLNIGERIPSHFDLPTIALPRRGRITFVDWTVREGGANLRLETTVDSGTRVVNSRTLAPNMAGDAATARLMVIGFGTDWKFTLRHAGGAGFGQVDTMRCQAKVLGGR